MFLRKSLFLGIILSFLSEGSALSEEMRAVMSEDKKCTLYTGDKKAAYVRYSACPERGPAKLTAVDKDRKPLFKLDGFLNEGHSVPEAFYGVEIYKKRDKTLWMLLDTDSFLEIEYVLPLRADVTDYHDLETAELYMITPNAFLFQSEIDIPFLMEAALDYVQIFSPQASEIHLTAAGSFDDPENYYLRADFMREGNKWVLIDADPKERKKALLASKEAKYIGRMSLSERYNFLIPGSKPMLVRATSGFVSRTDKETIIDLNRRLRKTGWYLMGSKRLRPVERERHVADQVIACERPYCTEFMDPLKVLQVKYNLDAYYLARDPRK